MLQMDELAQGWRNGALARLEREGAGDQPERRREMGGRGRGL